MNFLLPASNKAKVFDFTQATSNEAHWRPIVRKPDPVPENNLLKDRIKLKEWESQQNNIFHDFIYDRRIID